MNINFEQLFSSPKIKEKISSEQFKLSEILLDKRYELNLSFAKISNIVGLTEDEYIKYEYGNTQIPVEDYHKAIAKIEEYEKDHSQVNITLNKNEYVVKKQNEFRYETIQQSGDFDSQELFMVEAA